MKVIAMTPFGLDMNLGRAYNEAMEMLPEDGWACFLDHDAAWTTRKWYPQVVEAAIRYPETGLFTCYTNRIASSWQRLDQYDNHDMRHQRSVGEKQTKVRTLLDVTDTQGIGGVVMVVSKRAWRDVGGFVDGLLCVDHQMHFAQRKAGRKVYLIEGLYVYHWRRAFGDELPANAPRAAGCPCRGTERNPHVRVSLDG